ncbi:hypothetical protein L226DRAFT_57537 [Lentinus tigrinus ALCF2SS1-7]|uniref:uncharacterized protein n=1 Tax=Lentinus tigrinus ALCF2SS1-7 TaxID=1328758 RepID=UPI001165DE3E|nr:hypothetical protein L226DRAFT_57537 [Lentinus tigrinus ALCF2SS1-7]
MQRRSPQRALLYPGTAPVNVRTPLWVRRSPQLVRARKRSESLARHGQAYVEGQNSELNNTGIDPLHLLPSAARICSRDYCAQTHFPQLLKSLSAYYSRGRQVCAPHLLPVVSQLSAEWLLYVVADAACDQLALRVPFAHAFTCLAAASRAFQGTVLVTGSESPTLRHAITSPFQPQRGVDKAYAIVPARLAQPLQSSAPCQDARAPSTYSREVPSLKPRRGPPRPGFPVRPPLSVCGWRKLPRRWGVHACSCASASVRGDGRGPGHITQRRPRKKTRPCDRARGRGWSMAPRVCGNGRSRISPFCARILARFAAANAPLPRSPVRPALYCTVTVHGGDAYGWTHKAL